MFGRKDQYYQQKGISSLMLTAGNIFSTCIVLQNVSVYWTENIVSPNYFAVPNQQFVYGGAGV